MIMGIDIGTDEVVYALVSQKIVIKFDIVKVKNKIVDVCSLLNNLDDQIKLVKIEKQDYRNPKALIIETILATWCLIHNKSCEIIRANKKYPAEMLGKSYSQRKNWAIEQARPYLIPEIQASFDQMGKKRRDISDAILIALVV